MTINPTVAKIKQFKCSRRHRKTDKQTNKQTTLQKPSNINQFIADEHNSNYKDYYLHTGHGLWDKEKSLNL